MAMNSQMFSYWELLSIAFYNFPDHDLAACDLYVAAAYTTIPIIPIAGAYRWSL
ncbi:hypothetical protein [Flavobacterium sp. ZS1P14]|uniref:hypothetical protein n=1 Tax=Flavobacterium sp. ZS1P14 TaxID=3401729 RepID=UPI003AAECDDD